MPGAVFFALTLASAPTICLDTPAPDAIRTRLADYLRPTKLESECAATSRRVSFPSSGTQAVLRVEVVSGPPRTRALPWRVAGDRPLESLAEGGHLSELAVMIQALVLDDLLPAPADAAPVTDPPARRRRRRTRPARARPIPAAVPAPLTPTFVPAMPRSNGVVSMTGAPAVRRERTWTLGVQTTFRWRSPDLRTTEISGQLDRRGWYLRAGGSPTSMWSIDGRPIRVTAMSAATGYRHRIRFGGSFEWFGNLGVGGDVLMIRREDVVDSRTRTAVDVLGVLGSGVAYRPWDVLSIGVFVEGLAAPTARSVRIPDGPQTRLNRWGWRAGLEISLVFGRFVRAEDQSVVVGTLVE